jgi:hypothetical protein
MFGPSGGPGTSGICSFAGGSCGLQNRNARFDSWVPRSAKAPENRGFWLSRADRGVMLPMVCRFARHGRLQLHAPGRASPS